MAFQYENLLPLDRRDLSPTAIFLLGFARRAEAREAHIQALQAQLATLAIPDQKLVVELEEEKELLEEDRYCLRCLLNPSAAQYERNNHLGQTPYFGQLDGPP